MRALGSTAANYNGADSLLKFAREQIPVWSFIVASGASAVPGTSSLSPDDIRSVPSAFAYVATSSGQHWVDEAKEHLEQGDELTRAAVAELRRISGLTWEQLGQLFGVSRRSVHFWASGKPLNAQNQQQLLLVLDIVRTADRGDARANRSALVAVENGTSAFDLMVEGRVVEARERLGEGKGRRRPVLGPLGAAANAAREPWRPDELLATADDRVHRDPGRARAARTIRLPRRGTS